MRDVIPIMIYHFNKLEKIFCSYFMALLYINDVPSPKMTSIASDANLTNSKQVP